MPAAMGRPPCSRLPRLGERERERGGGGEKGGEEGRGRPSLTFPKRQHSLPRRTVTLLRAAAARTRAAAATAALAAPDGGPGSRRATADGRLSMPPPSPPPAAASSSASSSNDSDDADDDYDASCLDDAPSRRRWWWPRGGTRAAHRARRAAVAGAVVTLLATAAAAGTGVAAPTIRLGGYAVWRWCAVVAVTPIALAGVALAARAALTGAEAWLLTARGALYYLMGVRRWLVRLARVGALAAALALLFPPGGDAGASPSTATSTRRILLNMTACAAIACAASVVAAGGAKVLAGRFYARAHFDAMHDALRKEFVLVALSAPPRGGGEGGGGAGKAASAAAASAAANGGALPLAERSAVSLSAHALLPQQGDDDDATPSYPTPPSPRVERSCVSARTAAGAAAGGPLPPLGADWAPAATWADAGAVGGGHAGCGGHRVTGSGAGAGE